MTDQEPRRRRHLRPWRWLLGVLVFVVVLEGGLRLVKRHVGPGRTAARMYQAHPEVGFVLRPGLDFRVSGIEGCPPFRFQTNGQGLRGTRPVPPRREGEWRVLVLGDSFTYGVCADEEDTFPRLLEPLLEQQLHRPVTVINAGVPGYGTVQEAAFLETFGASFAPDMVVVAWYPNDDLDNVQKLIYVDGFVQRDPTLILGHTLFVWEDIMKNFVPREEVKSDARATVPLLARMKRWCAKRNVGFFVLGIPDRGRTRHALKKWNKEGELRYFPLPLPQEEYQDLFFAFRKMEQTPYLPEHHLNPLGHRVAAGELAARLTALAPEKN